MKKWLRVAAISAIVGWVGTVIFWVTGWALINPEFVRHGTGTWAWWIIGTEWGIAFACTFVITPVAAIVTWVKSRKELPLV